MTNDLAAAVERLRRVQNGERLSAVYHYTCRDQCDYDHVQTLHDIDRNAVANAYLAREADDAKPIDREWLKSVLENMGDLYIRDGGYEEGWCWKKHKAHDHPVIRYYGGLKAYYGQFADGRTPLVNRGDVRAFLRLARWPANGTNGGGNAEK